MSEICNTLHQVINQQERFYILFNSDKIPKNGIYILFEVGETAHNVDRIVRVGTHTGMNQLKSRLRQHFMNENKDRSIFRKNIGRALLNKVQDPFLEQWNLDLTTREAKEQYERFIDSQKQQEVKKEVSDYIQNYFSFIVFQVDDKSKRLTLESKIISTVSLCNDCHATNSWLGLDAPNKKIRECGLWLVNALLSKMELEELIKQIEFQFTTL